MNETAFIKEYQSLEKRFERRVEIDSETETWESVYLPNPIKPLGKVDYVLIGMEPSLGRWTKKAEPKERRKYARKLIDKGFRNFTSSIEDFIVHYCIQRTLCSEGEKYYITDLSKGAMLTDSARKGRNIRYRNWYDLLLDEVCLVSKENTIVISIGKATFEFLKNNKFEEETNLKLFTIPHYSNQATHIRNKLIKGKEDELDRFIRAFNIPDINLIANELLKIQEDMSNDTKLQILNRLPKELTEAKKKLIFIYTTCFTNIKLSQ